MIVEPPSQDIRRWAALSTNMDSPRWKDMLRERERNVVDFFRWVALPYEAVQAVEVEAWKRQLEGQQLALSTVATKLSHLRQFFAYLVERGELRRNPAADVAVEAHTTDEQAAPVPTFLPEHAVQLVAHLKAKATPPLKVSAKRDYALLLALLLTNIGRGALLNLRWQDMQPEDHPIFLSYRNYGKPCEVRIEDEAWLEAIQDYAEAVRRIWRNKQPDRPVWTRFDHAGEPGEPLSSQALSGLLRQYLREAKLPYAKLQDIRAAYQQSDLK